MATKITINDLLEAGVHFGHPTRRWNPKMKPYIHSARSGIYIIDLTQTMRHLAKACQYLYNVGMQGGEILFVATKRQAQEVVREAAVSCNQFHMTERWLGGTLTNNQTIRKSIARMKTIERLEETGELDNLPKKEASGLKREHSKLHKNLGGIVGMKKAPDCMVVVDVEREDIAVREARRLNIPIVAIVDTNCNPEDADLIIPANDDAVRSIKVLMMALSQSIAAAVQIRSKAAEAEMTAKAEANAEAEADDDDDAEGEDDDKAEAIAAEAAAPKAKAKAKAAPKAAEADAE